jgi:asparagine synthase (glutamine-hydrolysing)
MCGIVGRFLPRVAFRLDAALQTLHHRGPDAVGVWRDDHGSVELGHTRLSIIDLSDAGRQPMLSGDGRFALVFNGELYNYLELRRELTAYPFRTHTDTEVVIAAWSRWGAACLDRFIGMFAFLLWDVREQTLFAVRDRFGVKPLYTATLPDGSVGFASEIKTLHALGVERRRDVATWATYLTAGLTDWSSDTFWSGICAVPAGHIMTLRREAAPAARRWYDLVERSGLAVDTRDERTVRDEYEALLVESVSLRFRADVPVGINLSGGVDSSLLLGLVHAVQGPECDVKVFTFATGDSNYDELPWVEGMLERTRHPLLTCLLRADDVPALASRIAHVQDEPFGGIPTLAYATIFETARREGVIVLLDGQGLDEQWAGYDYYRKSTATVPLVQGTNDPAVRPECLSKDLVQQARAFAPPTAFSDRLRNVQLRDVLATKIPRALRFNDRVSMAASTELREPFLDHRLFELALRQPEDRKIRGDSGKWLLRQIAAGLVPDSVRYAPKRPVQTPQREWLRGPLRAWANDLITTAIDRHPDWFDARAARQAWDAYQAGHGDNSFWVWQWLSVALHD